MHPHDDNSPEMQRADAILPGMCRAFRKNRELYLARAARQEADLAAEPKAPCGHPQGFRYQGKVPCTGPRVCPICKQHEPVRDFSIENHGSIALVRPLNSSAKAWLQEHCPAGPDHQYYGYALVVEPRYLENLLNGIGKDGLSV